ncbi:hypothetical protein T440DRAFT_39884 [Plenodomus tracheiphilus IPT5]|uniref:Uncharacterized protein n=1 Tax=Plenodomus tracheiphilus IPT5 TaxID=1408161 RepID=A0A6A7BD78_9PLEO|nr:hypothetical protein T440DRAFT_39884 [Plenodomus tracheiphilus IPT5]
MAQAWIAMFKRFFERRGKFKARRASSPALTSLDHPENFSPHSVGQQHNDSFVVSGYEVTYPRPHSRDQSPILDSTDPYAQALKSPPPPVPLKITQHQDQHNEGNEKNARPCKPLLPHTSSGCSGLQSPILLPQPPTIHITCPSTTTSPYPADVSPLLSPILPNLPTLPTRNLPQAPPQIQTPTPTKLPTGPPTLPRQRYHPTRPAPRPPGPPRLSSLQYSSRGHEADVSPISTSLHWSCISCGIRETERSWRDSTMSALEDVVLGVEAPRAGDGGWRRGSRGDCGKEVRDVHVGNGRKGPLCISSPVPGSFAHVDGAFLRDGMGDGVGGRLWA